MWFKACTRAYGQHTKLKSRLNHFTEWQESEYHLVIFSNFILQICSRHITSFHLAVQIHSFDDTSEVMSKDFFQGEMLKMEGKNKPGGKVHFICNKEFQRSGALSRLILFQEHFSFLFHLWHAAQSTHKPRRPRPKIHRW